MKLYILFLNINMSLLVFYLVYIVVHIPSIVFFLLSLLSNKCHKIALISLGLQFLMGLFITITDFNFISLLSCIAACVMAYFSYRKLAGILESRKDQ